MAKRLDTEIIINLAGNLTAKARQYGANMSEFARRNERAMSVIKATSAAAGRGLDMLGNRYTGMIAGFAGGAMLREFTQLDRRMTRIGIAAEKTRDEMAVMLNGMQDASIKFRVDDSEVVNAIEKVGTVTGDIDFGYKNRNAIAASIAASGGSGESIGGLFANFTKFQVETEEDAIKSMDTLNKLGKEGAFELKDIAEKGVRAFSMYAAAGGRGVSGIKDVGVVLESAIDVTGDRDTAATATENFIRDLQNPKVAKALKENGINVFDKSGRMRELPVLLDEVAKRSGRKGAEKQNANLLNAGFNQDSILLISSVTSGKGAENLKRYQAVVGDGTSIMKDAEYAAKDFTSAMQSMNTTWNKFANNQLAKPVQELADALNSVDQATVQNWLEIGKNVAIATGGLLAARKAFQLGKGAYDFLRPGKKGVPKGVTDVFGSGVMPVYVVNMGAGEIGGAASGGKSVPSTVAGGAASGGKSVPSTVAGGAASGGKSVPSTVAGSVASGGKNVPSAVTGGATGFWGLAGRAIGGASMVVGMTSLADYGAKSIYEGSGLGDAVRGSSFRDWISESVDSAQLPKKVDAVSVWKEVTDWLTSAPPIPADPRPWANQQSSQYPFIPQQLQGEIEVTVKDDRVQVSKVKINTPGVTMSAQTGISNVEQD